METRDRHTMQAKVVHKVILQVVTKQCDMGYSSDSSNTDSPKVTYDHKKKLTGLVDAS